MRSCDDSIHSGLLETSRCFMKRRSFIQHLTLGSLFTALGGISLAEDVPQWRKPRLLVKPGVGVGPIRIGEPLPSDIETLLGMPEREFSMTREYVSVKVIGWGLDEGPTSFYKGVMIDLAGGRVKAVLLGLGTRAVTESGIYIGAPLSKAMKLYPNGERASGRSMHDYWKIPGLVFNANEDGRIFYFHLTGKSES